MSDIRTHHKITLGVFGRTPAGKVDKSVVHKVTLFTARKQGVIESVHDRVSRFIEEATGSKGAAEAPAYQIMGVNPVD